MRIAVHYDCDKQGLVGREVVLERVILEREEAFDEDVLPMAFVRLADSGERLLVFPEELDSPLPLPQGYVPPALRQAAA